MKLKDRDWTEQERRLAAVSLPMQQGEDKILRILRAALLAITLFGVAVLAVVVSYLACVSWITGR